MKQTIVQQNDAARPVLTSGNIGSICKALIWTKIQPKNNESESVERPNVDGIQKQISESVDPNHASSRFEALERDIKRGDIVQEQQFEDNKVKMHSPDMLNSSFDDFEDIEDVRPNNLGDFDIDNRNTFDIQNKFFNDKRNLENKEFYNFGKLKVFVRGSTMADVNKRFIKQSYIFPAQNQGKNNVQIERKALKKSEATGNLLVNTFKGLDKLSKKPENNNQLKQGLLKWNFVRRDILGKVAEIDEKKENKQGTVQQIGPGPKKSKHSDIFIDFYGGNKKQKQILL